MTDDEDIRDAALFRYWIKLASTTPSRIARALAHCTTPDAYRAALMKLAAEDRINLPETRKSPRISAGDSSAAAQATS